jgi:hypothetical protein
MPILEQVSKVQVCKQRCNSRGCSYPSQGGVRDATQRGRQQGDSKVRSNGASRKVCLQVPNCDELYW